MKQSGQTKGEYKFRRRHITGYVLSAVALIAGNIVPIFPQNCWMKLPSPTTRNLNKVFFIDSTQGWIVGDQATIIKTTDGGGHWIVEDPAIPNNIGDVNNIFMLNSRMGWALTLVPPNPRDTFVGTILLGTKDGGDSWYKKFFMNQFFNSIYFSDSTRGWMGSQDGSLLHTIDGGDSWIPSTVDSSQYAFYPIHTIKFLSPKHGFAVGGFREMTGVVWETTDYGNRWSVSGFGDELFDIHFIDSSHALSVGGGLDDGAGIAQTSDGGATWQFSYIGFRGQALAISYPRPSEGWVVLGNTGKCLYSNDSGKTWISLYTPESLSVADVRFIDSLHGYMVGIRGTILKYRPPSVSVEVRRGWNILSVPAVYSTMLPGSLYPTGQSSVFTYRGSYQSIDTLRVGEGFWMRFDSDDTLEFRGPYRFIDTIDAVPGWNMIGGVSFPVPVRSIIELPESIVSSPFWGYDSAYYAADTLRPGKGYWVKTRSAGKLIFNCLEERDF